MTKIIKNYCRWLSGKLKIVSHLAAENVALRQQLIVLKRNQKRPALQERDRMFWVLLSRIWSGWQDAIPQSTDPELRERARVLLEALFEEEVKLLLKCLRVYRTACSRTR